MRRFRNLVSAIAVLIAWSGAAYAQTAIIRANSVSALTGFPVPAGTNVYLASYYCVGSPCTPDGGEGLFVNTGASCPGGLPDGGSTIVDSGLTCFLRQNLNGDLRQWGITNGSRYDASINVAPVLLPSNSIVSKAFVAIGKIGLTHVFTNQVSIFLAASSPNPTLVPVGGSLSCEASGGGEYKGGVYAGLNPFPLPPGTVLNTKPGTIFLDHGAFIQFGTSADHNSNQDSNSIHNCIIAPEWLQTQGGTSCLDSIGNPGVTFTYPPADYSDLEAIRTNMIICGDKALYFNGASGARPHDLWIYGFDNPIEAEQPDHFILTNAMLDGNICLYTVQGGGVTKANEVVCNPFLTRQNLINKGAGNGTGNNICQHSASGGAVICNSEYWQISNIAPSTTTLNTFGRPNCTLKLINGAPNSGQWVSPPDVTLIPTAAATYKRGPVPAYNAGNPNSTGDPINYPMWIANLDPTTGGLGCVGHGPHAIANVTVSGGVATLDLLESEANPMPTMATWDACISPPCTIRIVSGDVDAMVAGEVVSSSVTMFPSGASLVNVIRESKGPDRYDGYIAEVIINAALPVASVGDSPITIDGLTYHPYTAGAPLCDHAGQGQCAFFHTGGRHLSGNSNTSDADQAVVALPESNAHFYSVSYLNNGTAGLCFFDAFSYGHHFGFATQDANSSCWIDKDGDGNGELDDLGEEFFVISGNSNQVSAQGIGAGQVGVGIVNDLYLMTDSASLILPINAMTINTSATLTLSGTGTWAAWPTDKGLGIVGGKGTAALCTISSCGVGGSNRKEYVTYELTGPNTAVLLARGQRFTTPLAFPSGSFLVFSAVSRPTGCDSFSSTSAPVTNVSLNSFEQIGGCLQLSQVKVPQGRNVFVGHNASHTQLASVEMPTVVFYFEDPTAMASMSGCENVLLLPNQWCQPPLAHGQTYFSYDSSNLRLELCPSNGSGLIVNSQLYSIPQTCLYRSQAHTTSSQLNYAYAANENQAVVGAAADGSTGEIQVTLFANTSFDVNDQVFATCYGVGGATVANTSGIAKMLSPNVLDFIGVAFSGASFTTGGACTLLGITTDTGGHSTAANGVETESSNPARTLVGMAYVGAANSISDSLTARDVSSWFNRQPKKMLAALGTNVATTTRAAFRTPTTNTVEGEFVIFNLPSLSAFPQNPNVQWGITSGAAGSAITASAGVGACFAPTSLGTDTRCPIPPGFGVEPEVSLLTVSSATSPLVTSGATNNLREGRNFMDIVMQISTGTLTLEQNGTFIDTYVWQ